MKKEKIVLVGSGQHCNVVLYNLREQGKYEVVCILDSDKAKIGNKVEGIDIVDDYSNLDMIKKTFGTSKFFISFGNMQYRKKVFEYFVGKGWKPVNVIHPNAIISANAQIGKGVLIECGCLITPNPVIGDNVVVNTGSQVNHDNIVGNHVYIASGVILSGGVSIGDNTLLDDGVIVTLGRTIGKNSIIGAGAVITKNIGDNVVAYGNPAREIRINK